eukprot:575110-Pyramimonas_sp.AAC.1
MREDSEHSSRVDRCRSLQWGPNLRQSTSALEILGPWGSPRGPWGNRGAQPEAEVERHRRNLEIRPVRGQR